MQRTQISIYVTEEQKARLQVLAAASMQTCSSWLCAAIDNAWIEAYGLGAPAIKMKSLLNASSSTHVTVKTADGRSRRVAG